MGLWGTLKSQVTHFVNRGYFLTVKPMTGEPLVSSVAQWGRDSRTHDRRTQLGASPLALSTNKAYTKTWNHAWKRSLSDFDRLKLTILISCHHELYENKSEVSIGMPCLVENTQTQTHTHLTHQRLCDITSILQDGDTKWDRRESRVKYERKPRL